VINELAVLQDAISESWSRLQQCLERIPDRFEPVRIDGYATVASGISEIREQAPFHVRFIPVNHDEGSGSGAVVPDVGPMSQSARRPNRSRPRMNSLVQEEISKPDISHRESGLWFTHRLPAVGVALLNAVFFVGISTTFGLHTQNSDAIQTTMQAILCPLLFLSSAFMALEILPRWVQLFALINPITDGIDAARAIMLQDWLCDVILPPDGVLVGLDVVFGAAAIRMLSRATKAG
jgi:hypothetical protein